MECPTWKNGDLLDKTHLMRGASPRGKDRGLLVD